jgi:hypothetical protein
MTFLYKMTFLNDVFKIVITLLFCFYLGINDDNDDNDDYYRKVYFIETLFSFFIFSFILKILFYKKNVISSLKK